MSETLKTVLLENLYDKLKDKLQLQYDDILNLESVYAIVNIKNVNFVKVVNDGRGGGVQNANL